MKAILVIEYENTMKELVRMLVENGYTVTVNRAGNYWEHKYKIEVSKDESNISD